MQAGVFFWSWGIWARLTFVLGGLIVFVLIFATGIKIFQARSNHGHVPLNETQQAERGEMIQMARSSNDLPFGLHAMEKDLEVEGLWNSQTTTPLHTPLHSPKHSSRDSSPLRSVLEKLTHSRRGSSLSSSTRFETPGSGEQSDLVHPDTQECPRDKCATMQDNPGTSGQQHRQSRSGSRGSSMITAWFTPDPNALEQQTYRPLAHHYSEVSQSIQRTNSTPKTSRTVIIGHGTFEDTTQLIGISSTLRNLETLDQMEAHRRYQAAESGQLRPRHRRSLNDGQTNCDTPSHKRGFTIQAEDTARSMSWPVADGDAVSINVRAKRKPDVKTSPPVIPLRAHIENNANFTRACPTAWSGRVQNMMNEVLEKTSDDRGRSSEISTGPESKNRRDRGPSPHEKEMINDPNARDIHKTAQNRVVRKSNHNHVSPRTHVEPGPVKERSTKENWRGKWARRSRSSSWASSSSKSSNDIGFERESARTALC